MQKSRRPSTERAEHFDKTSQDLYKNITSRDAFVKSDIKRCASIFNIKINMEL